MEVIGYKCFNGDMTNNYGFSFNVGSSYSVSGEIKAGINGNGYHMCERLEDTFRYFGCMNENIVVCLVIGSGNIVEFYDEYNGYYDMYSVEKIEIVKEVKREEIIQMMLDANECRVERFVQVFKLTDSEIVLFEDKFSDCFRILDAIKYYQRGIKDVYSKKFIRR